ncbi:hypothetical protein P7K49_034027 [Saguinus oedipus]|uniref:Secreted protein n=1 Tax=Saguinus oedipus TaxID=9490 RepID=A0ABQ9TUC4_SAGOE|nr:hypothetical protein P7K49_034027 [Saguinus oedipus]
MHAMRCGQKSRYGALVVFSMHRLLIGCEPHEDFASWGWKMSRHSEVPMPLAGHQHHFAHCKLEEATQKDPGTGSQHTDLTG